MGLLDNAPQPQQIRRPRYGGQVIVSPFKNILNATEYDVFLLIVLIIRPGQQVISFTLLLFLCVKKEFYIEVAIYVNKHVYGNLKSKPIIEFFKISEFRKTKSE